MEATKVLTMIVAQQHLLTALGQSKQLLVHHGSQWHHHHRTPAMLSQGAAPAQWPPADIVGDAGHFVHTIHMQAAVRGADIVGDAGHAGHTSHMQVAARGGAQEGAMFHFRDHPPPSEGAVTTQCRDRLVPIAIMVRSGLECRILHDKKLYM